MVATNWLVCCPEPPPRHSMGRERGSVCRAASCLPCSFRIWCVTFLAVSVPRLLMPCTELNAGQGYFLKSFVLAAGRSLGVGVQSNTSCESCSLPQVSRVLFSTIPFPCMLLGCEQESWFPGCRAGTRLPSAPAELAAQMGWRLKPRLGASRLALSRQLGCPGGEEKCPHVLLLQNWTRPAKMV